MTATTAPEITGRHLSSRPAATFAASRFIFWDIESLANAFTLCAYMPSYNGAPAYLNVFYLLDDNEDGTNLADALGADPGVFTRRFFELNRDLDPARVRVFMRDLRGPEANLNLARLMGLSNGRRGEEAYPDDYRLVADTDAGYDPALHPFLAGYNSYNYDTTMLSLYLMEAFPAPHRPGNPFSRVSAARMRAHNDALFASSFMPRYLSDHAPARDIRYQMLGSGRHMDVARLNEKQSRIALKRLLGQLGYRIKESERLSHDSVIETLDDLVELLVYNATPDCIGLSRLMATPDYVGGFEQRTSLMHDWPDTVYERDSARVRWDRMTLNSTSAQFIGRVLAPYGPLHDMQYVSYNYPHPDVAAQLGVPVVNVLDECVRFFESSICPDPATHDVTPLQARAHAAFMAVVGYYRDIEGRNFNDSEVYRRDFPGTPALSVSDIDKAPNNLPYFTADGSSTSCFATFSYGGIHGAEADLPVYVADVLHYRAKADMIARARELFPDVRDFLSQVRRTRALALLPDGTTVPVAKVLTGISRAGSDPDALRYKAPSKSDTAQHEMLQRARRAYPDPHDLLAHRLPEAVVLPDGTVLDKGVVTRSVAGAGTVYRESPSVPGISLDLPDGSVSDTPVLFGPKKVKGENGTAFSGATMLRGRYVHTSAALTVHQDFTSYYPRLLAMMRAFWNEELGEDRYTKIFYQKEEFGALRKDPSLSPEQRAVISVRRDGTKLLLNAASGAGDTAFESNIRMNNTIISMRIIGQLIGWRLAQAHTLAGARVISNNTDGQYPVLDPASGYTKEVSDKVLDETRRAVGIEIEPEEVFLVSKDVNNRFELEPDPSRPMSQWRVLDARGGSVGCYAGPRTDKNLAHPAAIDGAMVRYLTRVIERGGEQALSEPFDEDLGREVIASLVDRSDSLHTLLMFQNVVAASRDPLSFPFAVPVGSDIRQAADASYPHTPLLLYNRVFVARPGTPGAVHLWRSVSKVVPSATRRSRERRGLAATQTNDLALSVLRYHGYARTALEASQRGYGLIPEGNDVALGVVTDIDPTWELRIVNDDLHAMTDKQRLELIDSLDLDAYVRQLGDKFTSQWRNPVPQPYEAPRMAPVASPSAPGADLVYWGSDDALAA